MSRETFVPESVYPKYIFKMFRKRNVENIFPNV